MCSSDLHADLVRSEGAVELTNRAQYLVAKITDPYNIKNSRDHAPLLIGTFVEATIMGKTLDNVYPLPRHALRSNNRVATVDANQRLQLKSVGYNFEDEFFYYIDRGLEGQVEVVTSGMGVMVDGMQLKPHNSLKAAVAE